MILRTRLFRKFHRVRGKKKEKERWRSLDEFKNDLKNGQIYIELNNEENPDPWITSDKIKKMVKIHENVLNNNRISNPISSEDRKLFGEFKMNFQYHQVKFNQYKKFREVGNQSNRFFNSFKYITRQEFKTLPGYLEEDLQIRMKNLEEYPLKFNPMILYIDQLSRIYPKYQIIGYLFARKIDSIIQGQPYSPK